MAPQNGTVLGAIDIGTNSIRLKLARPLPDGSLETLHEERDPVRPGEGVFKTRLISHEVADRVLSTLRRYAALCRRHRARVRAVATSAVREARNQQELITRARREAGLDLEVVSGKEEARLICLGVLRGKPAGQRSVIVDVGGGSTEVAAAEGERPTTLWSISLGAVRLQELFEVRGALSGKQLRIIRQYAAEAVAEALPERVARIPNTALGSSGTVRAIVAYAAAPGTGHATRRQITRTVEVLAKMDQEARRARFDARRADIVVAGAVIVEAVANHLKLKSITAVDRGLRDGILVDMLRRRRGTDDPSLGETAVALGRRFYFDEAHARQVARLALSLFDDTADMHNLPASTRPLLEAAALLHDLGNAVSYQRHHRHTHYLILNADIPGLANHQRELVACVARFHRGTPPEAGHVELDGLTAAELQVVRKLSTLLRLADSFDRSHHQPVQKIRAKVDGNRVRVALVSRRPMDLEMWDAEREAQQFRRVFRKGLELVTARR